MSTHPSRRTVVRTAAWAVPAVTVVGAAPQFAASFIVDTTTSGTFNVNANVTAPVPLALGEWSMDVTSGIPETIHVGDTLNAPTLTVLVHVPETAADTLRGIGVTEVSGTAVAPYTLAGAMNTTLNANLTIPSTTLPATGGFTVNATGLGDTALTTTPGLVSVTIETTTVTMNLTGSAFPQATLQLVTDVDPSYELGTFTVS